MIREITRFKEVLRLMNEDDPNKKKRSSLVIRQMEIDDLAHVFHLGERIFTAREVPNLYRTWDEYEPVTLFTSERIVISCLVGR